MATGEKHGWRWALRRAVEILRREGPRSLFFQALAHSGYYRRVGWYVRLLDAPIADLDSATDTDLEIASVDVTDFEAYATLRPDVTKSHFTDRLRMGRSCYGVRLAGRLVAVVWVATNRAELDYLSREFFLRESELYLHDAFTDPDRRGRHLQPVLMAWLFRHHRARGFEIASRAVVYENRSQIRSCTRAGFWRACNIGYLRLGPWRWDFARGESEYLPLSADRRGSRRRYAKGR